MTSQLREDVIAGLAARPKRLQPKYFYDEAGARLFDRICELPEYYLTRAELSILRARASAIVASWGERVRVVEPGAGSGIKTQLILEALGDRCVEYVPIDVAAEHLAETCKRLRSALPTLRVTPIAGDFARELPDVCAGDDAVPVVYFPGSTIGNFDPVEARRLLAHFGAIAGDRGAVVIGLDLKKDPSILHAAYNDELGVTAAFNKNILRRINRELGANFDVNAFAHYAFYEPARARIEMHLVSLFAQRVSIDGQEFGFEEGESIHTESSHKYDLAQVSAMAESANLTVVDEALDDERRFAVLTLRRWRRARDSNPWYPCGYT
jgi:L-histidine Nalpha-methyltransferase